jgi:hypothetical protein
MLKQPTPAATPSDVERIVRRDFPLDQFDAVMNLLNEYGGECWQCERPRVQLAALKLAVGDLKKLRIQIDSAKCDYRDVLSGAEYPNYSRKCTGLRQPPPEEREQIIENDWKQYQAWLKGEADDHEYGD